MSQNCFEKILQMLHCADISNLDKSNKYTKICPLIQLIVDRFEHHFQPEPSLSHDKAMIEYFGQHKCKQDIRGEPIPLDYKMWCLNTPDSYLVTFDVYKAGHMRATTKTKSYLENVGQQF